MSNFTKHRSKNKLVMLNENHYCDVCGAKINEKRMAIFLNQRFPLRTCSEACSHRRSFMAKSKIEANQIKFALDRLDKK